MDEEKPKCAGLAQENGFFLAQQTLQWLGEMHEYTTGKEKSVINVM